MSAKVHRERKSETTKHPLVRHYIEALHRFRDDLKLNCELFEELPTFSAVVQHNKQLSQLITQCQSYLLECDNEKLPDDFKDMLKEEYAKSLEDLLNHPPSPVPRQLQNNAQDELLSDLDEFFQRVYERTIQNDGFKLYHVLIGAA